MAMLHLPPDLELDLSDPHSLAIRYPGSLHLSQTFGRPLASVHVGGNLVIDLDTVTGICVAGGSLTTSSPVEATRLTAGTLQIGSGVVRAAVLAASEKIIIGKCTLKVDVIIAPEIEIHPEAKGRVTVIESKNERAPTKIKGGFTLAEYEELFGDSEEFLSDRNAAPLGTLLPDLRSVGASAPQSDDDLPTVDVEDIVEIEETASDDDSYEGVAMTLNSPTMVEEPIPEAHLGGNAASNIDEEDSEIIKQARPLPPRAPTPMPPPKRRKSKKSTEADKKWFARFDHVVDQIIDLLDEPNAPINDLKAFTSDQEIEGIEHKLDAAWLATLRNHRQARTPVDAKVAHRFRVLSDLVAQGPK